MSTLQMPKVEKSIISNKNEIVSDLEKIVKSETILSDKDELRPYETDALAAYTQSPMLVVLPETAKEVSEVLKYCNENKIGVMAHSVLAKGLLTGKYKRDETPPPNTRGSENPSSLNIDELSNEFYNQLEQFESEATDAGLSPAKYAIEWLLGKQGICSVVIGGKKLEQLDEFLS